MKDPHIYETHPLKQDLTRINERLGDKLDSIGNWLAAIFAVLVAILLVLIRG
jgi:hypothetical protein